MKHSLDAVANAAVRVIERLEPQLWNACGNEPLYLALQPDAAGIKGDFGWAEELRAQRFSAYAKGIRKKDN